MPILPEDVEQQLKESRRSLVPPTDGVPNGYALRVVSAEPEGFAWRQGADREILQGNGDPNGNITAAKGMLYVERDAPALWQNTDGQEVWQLVGSGGGGEFIEVVVEASAQTPLGIGDDQQNIVWDNIYETDPSLDNVSGDIPALPPALGLSGRQTFGGVDDYPFTFFKATENGAWLVTFTAIMAATTVENVALTIFGDFRDHYGSPITPMTNDLQEQDYNVSAVVVLKAGDEFWMTMSRDDSSAAYDGVTSAVVRIVRLDKTSVGGGDSLWQTETSGSDLLLKPNGSLAPDLAFLRVKLKDSDDNSLLFGESLFIVHLNNDVNGDRLYLDSDFFQAKVTADLSIFGDMFLQHDFFRVEVDKGPGDAVRNPKFVADGSSGDYPSFGVVSADQLSIDTDQILLNTPTNWDLPHTEPADADVKDSNVMMWLDDAPGATELHFKAKDSAGTVRTATISLT